MLSFKPAFSRSSFTLIKRLFSFSSSSTIRVVSHECVFVFWATPHIGLSSLTRDRTCTPYIGTESFNHWISREVLTSLFWIQTSVRWKRCVLFSRKLCISQTVIHEALWLLGFSDVWFIVHFAESLTLYRQGIWDHLKAAHSHMCMTSSGFANRHALHEDLHFEPSWVTRFNITLVVNTSLVSC